ncbi:MAG: ornithine cyclodeaminase family protein [Verrucomicrobiaceae bacterium]|nr:ornithine cyclodeaminase family protein [Verrucomicrobiaceae bacterium]
MPGEGTLLLGRGEVARLLSLPDCIAAVEEVFRAYGEGQVPPPGVLGIKSEAGGLHIKAGYLPGPRNYIVAKLNTNFAGNQKQGALPTIQGLILLCDGDNGQPLAVLDSIEITIRRTAAASAVAAKYLARPESSVVTICGCGAQGRAQLRALRTVLPLAKIFASDLNPVAAQALADDMRDELSVEAETVTDLARALRQSDVCVTCTTATAFFVSQEDVSPGTFIAAVGADDVHKQEIEPALMAAGKVVADHLEQCCAIGDTHHAIAAGLMRKSDVYAELAEVVAGRKPGRTSASEIIIFDSTGVAIEDAVAAVAVYEMACETGTGSRFEFSV